MCNTFLKVSKFIIKKHLMIWDSAINSIYKRENKFLQIIPKFCSWQTDFNFETYAIQNTIILEKLNYLAEYHFSHRMNKIFLRWSITSKCELFYLTNNIKIEALPNRYHGLSLLIISTVHITYTWHVLLILYLIGSFFLSPISTYSITILLSWRCW